MVEMRGGSCFSGVIEFFVPPYPPAYTPMAVPMPQAASVKQIGVTLVKKDASHPSSNASRLSSLSIRRHSRETAYVFKLQQEDAFCKYVSLTHSEFNQMMIELKATFPTQLESHYVVDVKKIWFIRFRRVFTQTEQDLLHTLRQLVMIPEVLESVFFHRSLSLSLSESMELTTLAERIRSARKQAQDIDAFMDEETKRITKQRNQSDFDYAEMVFSRVFIASRYLCTETIRQPLLIYDHEMLLKITSSAFPHRVHVVTGPGDHTYFHFKRRHKMWCLADTFNNELAQLTEEADLEEPEMTPEMNESHSGGRSSLVVGKARYQRYTVRRAFPACRLHQQHQNFQLIPCISAIGDRKTRVIEIQAVPSCGAFASLGTIVAEPRYLHSAPDIQQQQHQGALVSYKITARHESGFTFFLGNYERKTRQRVHLQVHPGQDLLAMLMIGQLIDQFVLS
uniref:PX domain-containing protein n=1 Tax=Globisporangium ultimum (strain ATCC 200006 / CBS 805.95 / DAOM BR144) TaxID=431595 RepID=K3WUB0_GLOUD